MTVEEQISSVYRKVFNDDWYEFLAEFIQSPAFRTIERIEMSARRKYLVFPEKSRLFRAFQKCSLKDTKVIWITQDPYSTYAGQATGLATAVENNSIPPTLKNIFKELVDDLGQGIPDPSLEVWANQGVLLLNRALSVKERTPGSHLFYWKSFTSYVVQKLSNEKEEIVFILLGKPAQEMRNYIDLTKHNIIEVAHPAAESYNKNAGFYSSKIFSRTNEYLENAELTIINWTLNNDLPF